MLALLLLLFALLCSMYIYRAVSWCKHGIAVRNRLAVRIAGSHPADRGSIPRYGSNQHGLQPENGRLEILVPQNFLQVLTFC